ncbi:MAG: LytTR family DNA-binding domain-containing protein [Oscillospiraceae bacterium]|nr:LytTR family DNA-binding domain-containing protein [Oscillospiraceae bacterium]
MTTKLNIAICEDSADDLALLSGLILHSGLDCSVDAFGSGSALLDSFRPGVYQAVFLDIYMDGLDGIETARRLRGLDPSALLAFVTSSVEHTYESYSLGALKYLVKPLKHDAIVDTLELAAALVKSRKRLVLPLGKSNDLYVDDITFVEQNRHDVSIYTLTGHICLGRSVTLDELEEALPSPPFLRCHRSFIVNFRHVRGVGTDFEMPDGRIAYIRQRDFLRHSRAYRNWLLENGVE